MITCPPITRRIEDNQLVTQNQLVNLIKKKHLEVFISIINKISDTNYWHWKYLALVIMDDYVFNDIKSSLKTDVVKEVFDQLPLFLIIAYRLSHLFFRFRGGSVTRFKRFCEEFDSTKIQAFKETIQQETPQYQGRLMQIHIHMMTRITYPF